MEFIAKQFSELTTTELYEIIKSRTEIFLLEQKIICQDLDDIDYKSLHCFLYDEKRVAAYLRAYPSDDDRRIFTIGRVLTLEHNNGYGKRLMENSLELLKKDYNIKKIHIHAQTHAIGFYEKFGFKTVSDEFLEEGVPHITMELNL